MTTGNRDLSLTVQRTVAFGDCDPAGIVYTPRVLDYCLEAIDELWRTMLDGRGWYELNLDHNRGTPFVNVKMNFTGPMTPREILEITVRPAKVGRTSITFEVVATQSERECFSGTLTSVIVEKGTMTKVDENDWTIAAVRTHFET